MAEVADSTVGSVELVRVAESKQLKKKPEFRFCLTIENRSLTPGRPHVTKYAQLQTLCTGSYSK